MHDDCEAAIQVQQFDGERLWLIGLDNPYPVGDMRNVVHQYQQCRERFLASDADALLLVEHDNILPDARAAQRLYDTPADLVYGCYMLRHGSNVLNIWRYEGDRNLGQSWTLYPDEFRRIQAEQTLVRVSGVGFGCLLIRRHIVENYPFRPGEPTSYAPDIPFAQDVLRAGIVSVARLDVAVDHYHNGVRLAPFVGIGAPMIEVSAMEDVNVLVDGQVLHMRRGNIYTVPQAEAAELMRAGYVQILSVQAPVLVGTVPESAMIEPTASTMLPPSRKRRAG